MELSYQASCLIFLCCLQPAVVSETAWTYDDADEDVEDIDVTASKVSADEWENFRLTNA